MDTSTVAALLASLVSGGGIFFVGRWVLNRIPKWNETTKKVRFFWIYGLSFGLGAAAYGGQVALGYVVFNPDGLLAAMVASFTVSQTLWGLFGSGRKDTNS